MESLDSWLSSEVTAKDMFGGDIKNEPSYGSKGNYSATNNKDKKEVNLWSSTDIKKVEIDVSKFKKTKKTFAIVAYNGKDSLPDEAKEMLDKICSYLFAKGYKLRVNGDTRSSYTIDYSKTSKDKLEVYLPWKKFNPDLADSAVITSSNEKGYGIALTTRNKFLELPDAARALVANNVHLVLGKECDEPLDLLLVYNKNGSEVLPEKKVDYDMLGYTAYFMKLAEAANIPVFNIKKSDVIDRLSKLLKSKEHATEGEHNG
jgi:hypothetical protein